jgi:glycerol-3-phosphate acyltransferase PlsY
MIALLLVLSLLPFYALGAFPTGRLVAARHGMQIEAHGSGNVGATNVARVVGKKAGLLTLAGDVVKGLGGILLAQLLFADATLAEMAVRTETATTVRLTGAMNPRLAAIAGLVLVAGHCFSFPRWRGGKGVATALGVLLGLAPGLAVAALLLFATTFAWWRIVSLSSITAALSAPIINLLLGYPDDLLGPIALIAILVSIRHKENLVRLVEGREPRFNLP